MKKLLHLNFHLFGESVSESKKHCAQTIRMAFIALCVLASIDAHSVQVQSSSLQSGDDGKSYSKELVKRAGSGDAEAQYRLGICYTNGKGITQDYNKAAKWFKKAAEQGHVNAQYSMGLFYDYGRGVKKDPSKAAEWYQKAAEQGNAKAQFALGIYYSVDLKNHNEAVKWLTKAAEQGHADAQYNLGLCYIYGKGVSKDYTEAIKWFQKATKQGHKKASNAFINAGKDLDDINELTKVAEQGNADAQYYLGNCYFYGKGVKQDYNEANKWYQKAAEQGHKQASNAAEDLKDLIAYINNPEAVDTTKIFDIVEQMPSFPGGDAELMKYLSSNIRYPIVAEENGIQGRVICKFVVERDGRITNIEVAKSVNPDLDKEAVRVLSTMPRWIPGRQNGKVMRVKYTLPVTFRLK